MKTECFDVGVIQTFVDGELGSGRVGELVKHLSVCEECTLLATELENENDLAFAALDSDLNTLVPTERLRSKVFASIQDIESRESTGFWARTVAGFGLTGLAARPGIAVFAGVLLIVAFAAVGTRFLNKTSQFKGETIARSDREGSPADQSDIEKKPAPVDGRLIAVNEDQVEEITQSQPGKIRIAGQFRAMNAVHRPRPKRKTVRRKVSARRDTIQTRGVPAPLSPELDAEDGYLRTIATLNRTVNENKDYVMRPSERVTFERDLAVVNDAIRKMKGEVRQNPRNSAAREVLRASYKNKIDLLNSVAERSETVASLD